MDRTKVSTHPDRRFHRTLFGSLESFDKERPPFLIYVENRNMDFGYGQLAISYKMAADALIVEKRREPQSGSLDAPIAFMVRQTLELSLKDLLDETVGAGNRVPARVMHSHNLLALWSRSRKWFQQNNYLIVDDDRLDKVDWMVENFNAVDPTGELFRFANSRLEAFGRSKTYDRAGFYMSVMVPLFEASYSFLTYWSGTLTQERFKREGLI